METEMTEYKNDRRFANDPGAHAYEITARDKRDGKLSTFDVCANTRTSAAAKLKRLGYEPLFCNMVG